MGAGQVLMGILGAANDARLTGLGLPLDTGFSGTEMDKLISKEIGPLRRGMLVFGWPKKEAAGAGQPQQPGIVVAPNINPNIIGGGPGQPGRGGYGGPGGPPVYINFQPHVEGGRANPILVNNSEGVAIGSVVPGVVNGSGGNQLYDIQDGAKPDVTYVAAALNDLYRASEGSAGRGAGKGRADTGKPRISLFSKIAYEHAKEKGFSPEGTYEDSIMEINRTWKKKAQTYQTQGYGRQEALKLAGNDVLRACDKRKSFDSILK